jgi:hypothetical protein
MVKGRRSRESLITYGLALGSKENVHFLRIQEEALQDILEAQELEAKKELDKYNEQMEEQWAIRRAEAVKEEAEVARQKRIKQLRLIKKRSEEVDKILSTWEYIPVICRRYVKRGGENTICGEEYRGEIGKDNQVEKDFRYVYVNVISRPERMISLMINDYRKCPICFSRRNPETIQESERDKPYTKRFRENLVQMNGSGDFGDEYDGDVLASSDYDSDYWRITN